MEAIPLDPHRKEFFRQNLPTVDLAFIALHGKGGEDGEIQRRLEGLRIPYVGADAKGSRTAFNKLAAKRIFRRRDIATPDYLVLSCKDKKWKERLKAFGAPVFIKPLCEGSSIGVFPVEDLPSSFDKIEKALKQYGTLLAERKIKGREFTVGILGHRVLPVIELCPKRGFYDYRAKYTKGLTDYLVPAPVPLAWQRRMKQVALQAHQSLGLRDFSRVDLMVDREGQVYVLEVNTIPGLTELSLLPKAAQAAGISFERLCFQLVAQAASRIKANGKGRNNGKTQT